MSPRYTKQGHVGGQEAPAIGVEGDHMQDVDLVTEGEVVGPCEGNRRAPTGKDHDQQERRGMCTARAPAVGCFESIGSIGTTLWALTISLLLWLRCCYRWLWTCLAHKHSQRCCDSGDEEVAIGAANHAEELNAPAMLTKMEKRWCKGICYQFRESGGAGCMYGSKCRFLHTLDDNTSTLYRRVNVAMKELEHRGGQRVTGVNMVRTKRVDGDGKNSGKKRTRARRTKTRAREVRGL